MFHATLSVEIARLHTLIFKTCWQTERTKKSTETQQILTESINRE
jgi:hypothetical protein